MSIAMKRFAALIAYDGGMFYGWQIQVQSPTVQGCLERALSEIASEKILVIGAGRTDSGVHSVGQVAHFDFPVNMTAQQIKMALNSKLSYSIQIIDIVEVSPDFHSRYDAIERTYQYIITTRRTPFNLRFKAHFPKYKIDIDVFRQCIPYFLGEQDFTSFAKPNPEITNHICFVKHIDVVLSGADIVVEITANRFLHNMVRRIIGAMLAVSHRSLPAHIISEWINLKRHQQKNYTTAPANGLYLSKILYPEAKVRFSNQVDYVFF